MKLIKIATAALMAATLGTSAMAHASLEQQEAKIGSFYKGVMRIGHGCGDQATLKLRITIPEGVISVKPMPKPGWTLKTVTGAYEGSYDYYGKTLSEGVTEIIWTGELPDAHYDEFSFRAKLHGTLEADKAMYFPTVQECAGGKNAWIEIPADGQDPHDLKRPAPGLHLVSPGAHTH